MEFVVFVFGLYAVVSAILLLIERVLLEALRLAGLRSPLVAMGAALLGSIAILPALVAGHGIGIVPLLVAAGSEHSQISPLSVLFMPLTFAVAWWAMGKPRQHASSAPSGHAQMAQRTASASLKFPDESGK